MQQLDSQYITNVEQKNNSKYFGLCPSCSKTLVECSVCTECKNTILAFCQVCEKRHMIDTHDFCYCQLEIFAAIMNSKI